MEKGLFELIDGAREEHIGFLRDIIELDSIPQRAKLLAAFCTEGYALGPMQKGRASR